MILIGERLKEAREAKKLTQKKLAELTGTKNSSISEWEKDKHKPDIDTIEILCGVLEIEPCWLLGVNVSKPSLDAQEQNLINSFRSLETNDKEYFSEIIQMRAEVESPIKKIAQ